MKIVKVTIGGEPAAGDTVMLFYSAARGGRTEAGHVVQERQERAGNVISVSTESIEEVAAGLSASMGKHFMPECFKWQAKGSAIRIECQDLVDDVTFAGKVIPANGRASAATIDILEL